MHSTDPDYAVELSIHESGALVTIMTCEWHEDTVLEKPLTWNKFDIRSMHIRLEPKHKKPRNFAECIFWVQSLGKAEMGIKWLK